MAEKILFVVEGAKTEPALISNIQKTFFSSKADDSLIIAYEGNIYEFWNQIKDEIDELDILELIRKRVYYHWNFRRVALC